MHKRTAHNDTEPIEEEQEAYFEPPTGQCERRWTETVTEDDTGDILRR